MLKVKKPTRPKITPISCEEAQALIKQVEDSTYEFSGQFEELESALGMLFLGKLFGWRLILLIHNSRTIRKYEKILDIKIRDEFPEEGPYIHKSQSYKIVKELKSFWKAVDCRIKVDNRRELA